MMLGFGFGFVELLLLAMLVGNPGVPLGVPPADEDPLMYRLAPEECLYYSTWAGVAAPDPNSDNLTEKMLAQQELQQAIAKADAIAMMLSQRMAEEGDPVSRAMARLTPTLLRTMLTQPTAVYVADVELGAEGLTADAGLVLDAGGQEEAILQALGGLVSPELVEELELEVDEVEFGGLTFTEVRFQPAAPPIYWGRRGRYIVIAAGEKSIQNLFARVETDPPAWLEELRKELPVQRTSSVAFLNLSKVQQLAEPWMMFAPEIKDLVEQLQIENLSTYRCVTGLDEQGYVVRSQLQTTGPVKPLELLADLPLSAIDLESIPADSPAVFAAKFDSAKALDLMLEMFSLANGMNPRDMKDELSEGIEQATGITLDQLVTQVLDDTVYVYASPTDGGLVSGWTAAVRLREPMLAQQSAQRFFGFMSAMLRNEREAAIRTQQFESFTINYLEVNDDDFWVVPCWTVTGSELVFGLYPQAVKSHLARKSEMTSIAELPAFAASLEDGDPMKNEGAKVIVQLDHAELVRVVYPFVQMAATFMLEELNEELDLNVQISDFPSIKALTQHTQPMRGVLSKTPEGYEAQIRQTVPTGDLITSLPMIATLTLPAVNAAQMGSRRTQSVNNLKQLALALHNYADVHRSFPAAFIADEMGKPLLSWRVHMLPYLEQQALYEQFHLDEPWDSEHNKKLIEKMPAVFAVPGSDLSEGLTNYLGVSGKNNMFPPPDRDGFGETHPHGREFRDVVDGTSNTAMIVEVNNENRVIWTQPEDFGAPGMQPLERLMGLWKQGFHVAIADGSVRMIPKTIEQKQLQNLFQVNDGNVLDIPFNR